MPIFYSSSRDRIQRRIRPDPVTGCWNWQGSKNAGGYGLLALWDTETKKKKSTAKAHRFSYETFVGPVPDGMCVLHRCDRPGCVNPEHLFLGTKGDNNRDRSTKGRSRGLIGENHLQAKLTEAQVREIRARYATGSIYQRELGDLYGVSQEAIGFIVRNVHWKHVSAEV